MSPRALWLRWVAATPCERLALRADLVAAVRAAADEASVGETALLPVSLPPHLLPDARAVAREALALAKPPSPKAVAGAVRRILSSTEHAQLRAAAAAAAAATPAEAGRQVVLQLEDASLRQLCRRHLPPQPTAVPVELLKELMKGAGDVFGVLREKGLSAEALVQVDGPRDDVMACLRHIAATGAETVALSAQGDVVLPETDETVGVYVDKKGSKRPAESAPTDAPVKKKQKSSTS